MSHEMITGSLVALVTPMQANGDVDNAALEKLLDWHIEQGTDGIITMGTTGESATLDQKSHCAVIQFVVDYVAKRVPVIAGTGANSTTEAIALTQCAANAGVDACLLVSPYYNKPTQEGLYLHHKAIAEAVNIPQILYNVPGRTACDMLPPVVKSLSDISNIVGIKEATGDLTRITQIRQDCGEGFAIYSGDDESGRKAMLIGANGVISVTTNVAPKLMHEMCVAAINGDSLAAEEIDKKLLGLHQSLFVEANPIPVKWVMAEMGMMGLGIRLPLTVLSTKYHDVLRQAMKQAKAL